MDDALIYVALISGLFTLAAISLMNMNWFKRERFKFSNQFEKRKYDLQLKKMARDLGLSASTSKAGSAIPGTSSQGLTISPDLISKFLKNATDDEGETGGEIPTDLEGLIAWGLENRDHPAVKALIDGFTSTVKPKDQEGGSNGFI